MLQEVWSGGEFSCSSPLVSMEEHQAIYMAGKKRDEVVFSSCSSKKKVKMFEGESRNMMLRIKWTF